MFISGQVGLDLGSTESHLTSTNYPIKSKTYQTHYKIFIYSVLVNPFQSTKH
jgi:hypothetical protein